MKEVFPPQFPILEKRIQGIRAINVNRRSLKDLTVETVSGYFEHIRPQIVADLGETGQVIVYDKQWQSLIRLSQVNNAKSTYLSVIGALKKTARELQVLVLTGSQNTGQSAGRMSSPSESEQTLINTLDKMLPSSALSYRQGIADLRQSTRFSYRGTASEFRETLREVLDKLAPDEDVMREPTFRLDNGRSAPTMKQKVRYILRSRGTNKARKTVAEKSLDLIEGQFAEVTRAIYDRASASTHSNVAKDEVVRLKRYIDTVLFDLLEVT